MPHASRVLFNVGNGRFRDSGQELNVIPNKTVLLHDFDDDGDVDVFFENHAFGDYRTFIFGNDGNGRFVTSIRAPQQEPRVTEFDGVRSEETAWGDVDGDGDLDAFMAQYRAGDSSDVAEDYLPNVVWLNDSGGNFNDSGQRLGALPSSAVSLGDVDGDGDLDAVVGNQGPNEVWLNDGNGRFRESGQRLPSEFTRDVIVADMDGDGDLDAVVGEAADGIFARPVAKIWLNDGSGRFTKLSQQRRFSGRASLAVGDVTGDGAPDVVVGRVDDVTVWPNDGNGRLQHPWRWWLWGVGTAVGLGVIAWIIRRGKSLRISG